MDHSQSLSSGEHPLGSLIVSGYNERQYAQVLRLGEHLCLACKLETCIDDIKGAHSKKGRECAYRAYIAEHRSW